MQRLMKRDNNTALKPPTVSESIGFKPARSEEKSARTVSPPEKRGRVQAKMLAVPLSVDFSGSVFGGLGLR